MNKKGLIVTLLTVAFAFAGLRAHAEAPVIDDPGDYIIGDLEDGAANNVFVYPDAINLNAIVSDDTTPDASIKWSYSSSRYRINGVAPMDLLGGDDPNNPGAKNLNGNNLDPYANQDGNSLTVTLRDETASPIAGHPGPYADPGTTGVIASETITLFASDCSTWSQRSITLYTSNNTSDSISRGGSEPVLDDDFEADGPLGWVGAVLRGTGTTGTATGLCMWVPLVNTAADAQIAWLSPPALSPGPGYIEVLDRMVYLIRLFMYTDQTAADAIPFWDFGWNNFFLASGLGNNYGAAFWTLDVAGGAAGINGPANGRPNGASEFVYAAFPIAGLTDQMRGLLVPPNNPANANALINNPATDSYNDMLCTIRVLDGAADINTNADAGTICLRRIRVSRILYDQLIARRSGPSYAPPISTATHSIFPDDFSGGGNGTGTISNATNSARFAMGPRFDLPNTPANQPSILGGRKQLIFDDKSQGNDFALRLWPLLWQSDVLMQLEITVRSDVNGGVGTTEGTDPLDVMFIDAQTPLSEIGGFQFFQKSAPGNAFGAGSPVLPANTSSGTAQVYTGFFYSQKRTAVDPGVVPNADRIRMYPDFINNSTLGNASDGRDPFVLETMGLYSIDINGL